MRSLSLSPLGFGSSKHTDVTLHQAKLPLSSQRHVFSSKVIRSITIVFSQSKEKWAPTIAADEAVHHVPNNSVLFMRREAVGFGLGFGVVELLSQKKASNAASSCELTVAPSGLAFCDKVLGFGPEAVKGQLIKAHYVGKLENGKVFDSSYNRGKPLTFRVGVGEVIRGWDEGIVGGDGIPPMLAGGKRLLKLPPELAYGGRGAGCKGGSCIIPPDSVLLFDVEFIGKA